MRRILTLAAILLIGAAATAPSFAADDKDKTVCFSLGNDDYKDKTKYDGGLDACSRMISSRRYKGKDLAAIYRARASWKQKKGALDGSLTDYGKSIRIEPENVETYDYRADVYLLKGDYDKALADYDHATHLDPTYAAAFYSRGLIYEKKGEADKARAEYNAAIALPAANRIAQWAQDKAQARLKALDEEAKK